MPYDRDTFSRVAKKPPDVAFCSILHRGKAVKHRDFEYSEANRYTSGEFTHSLWSMAPLGLPVREERCPGKRL